MGWGLEPWPPERPRLASPRDTWLSPNTPHTRDAPAQAPRSHGGGCSSSRTRSQSRSASPLDATAGPGRLPPDPGTQAPQSHAAPSLSPQPGLREKARSVQGRAPRHTPLPELQAASPGSVPPGSPACLAWRLRVPPLQSTLGATAPSNSLKGDLITSLLAPRPRPTARRMK